MLAFQDHKYEMRHLVKIQTKDGRAKITMTDFVINGTEEVNTPIYDIVSDDALYRKNGKFKPYNRQHKERLIVLWRETLASAKKKLSSTPDDNW